MPKAKKAAKAKQARPAGAKKPVVVAVSGGFDPIHIGHVRMFEEAKKLGDKLVVILNNDNWLKQKKGYVFMSEQERKEVIKALKPVDDVFITKHGKNPKDMSVCAELRIVRPDIFANGGDRVKSNVPEVAVCEEIAAEMIFNIGPGGKIQSSSWLLANYLKLNSGRKGKTIDAKSTGTTIRGGRPSKEARGGKR